MSAQRLDFDSHEGVAALVERFGGLRPCAARLGLAVGTVQGWKKRGSVPATHQQRIRDLIEEKAEQATEETADTGMGGAFASAAKQETKQETKKKAVSEKSSSDATPVATPGATPAIAPEEKKQAREEESVEEEIVSAFTVGGDTGGSSSDEGDEGLDISSDVWEHAALPRSTSGQWAILISLIALAGVVTRPLWAERIDEKLMATLHSGEHATEAHGDDHSDDHGETDTHGETTESGAQSGAASGAEGSRETALALALPSDLSARLQRLERDLEAVSAQQSAPAAAELRRLKSESDALAAAFDNQAARLDSLSTLLQQRAEVYDEDLTRLRSQVERLEQSRATERLSRRLSALFQLENIAYAIAQQSAFSLDALESSLSLSERERMEGALSILQQAENLKSSQQLLSDYRRLLPDLLSWQARISAEEGGERGLGKRVAERLRAQLFGVFSLRRRYGTEQNALLLVERMLADGRLAQAEESFSEALSANTSAREDLSEALGEEAAARLEAFRAALSLRNSVFAALREIRATLSSRETGGAPSRRPSS